MAKLPKPAELSKIDLTPPKTDWMNTPVVFKEGMYCHGFLYLFLPRAVLSAPAKLSEEAETCLTCHAAPGTKTFSDKTTVSVQVDGKGFASSVHSPLGCTSCHTDVNLDNHPSATYATKQQFVVHVVKACRTCHADSQLTANPVHQRAISRADAQPCSACHGSHTVVKTLARKDKGTDTQYCLTCHSKPLTRSPTARRSR